MLHVFLFLLAVANAEVEAEYIMSPVIIVPGTAGSQIQAKLNKPSSPHFYCDKTSDWYTLWLSITNLIPPALYCWCDNMRLLWDATTTTYSNNVGVSTRVPGWGDTATIEYLDPDLKSKSGYFHTLVEALVTKGGLVRGKSLRGAPYDFRYSPTSTTDGETQPWIAKMLTLVEETYGVNGNRSVSLISHSLGCLFTLHLLNTQTTAWKAKYVKQWIAVSGVWGGAGSGLKQLLSGDSSYIPGISGLTVRPEQRSYESSMLLAPTPQIWAPSAFPLVRTPARNFTAADYAELFPLADFTHGYRRWSLLSNLTANLHSPAVATTHLFGSEVPTPTAFEYGGSTASDFSKSPGTINSDGDGTVPMLSLAAAKQRWDDGGNEGFNFSAQAFPKCTHEGILKDSGFVDRMLQLLE